MRFPAKITPSCIWVTILTGEFFYGSGLFKIIFESNIIISLCNSDALQVPTSGVAWLISAFREWNQLEEAAAEDEENSEFYHSNKPCSPTLPGKI